MFQLRRSLKNIKSTGKSQKIFPDENFSEELGSFLGERQQKKISGQKD